MPERSLVIDIQPQPDDVTCGPSSLHAVYRYWGLEIMLDEVIESVGSLRKGGTLATLLGIDALRRGFDATLYTYNLKVFDPVWKGLDPESLAIRLEQQLRFKKGKKFGVTTRAYVEFVRSGGRIKFANLTSDLLQKYFDRQMPVLAGLSATYLYESMREYPGPGNRSVQDDLRGEPAGHFVVLYGLQNSMVTVADPYLGNPLSNDNYYSVDVRRLINAIMLGTVTYDANLLVIAPASAQ